MVDYYDIRCTSPSVAFFFARLGAFICSPSGHCPRVGGFVLGDNSLGLVLGDLYPLLCQSLDWFGSVREALRREHMGSEVRSSDLESGLSSSGDTAGVERERERERERGFLGLEKVNDFFIGCLYYSNVL